jgi:hypothetical protein
MAKTAQMVLLILLPRKNKPFWNQPLENQNRIKLNFLKDGLTAGRLFFLQLVQNDILCVQNFSTNQ